MRTPRILPALACLCLVGCAAPPRDAAAPAAVTTASPPPRSTPAAVPPAAPALAAAEEKDPVVCKNFAPIGTRFVRRGCMRKSQWEQAARDGREAVERVQRNGLLSGNGSGG